MIESIIFPVVVTFYVLTWTTLQANKTKLNFYLQEIITNTADIHPRYAKIYAGLFIHMLVAVVGCILLASIYPTSVSSVFTLETAIQWIWIPASFFAQCAFISLFTQIYHTADQSMALFESHLKLPWIMDSLKVKNKWRYLLIYLFLEMLFFLFVFITSTSVIGDVAATIFVFVLYFFYLNRFKLNSGIASISVCLKLAFVAFFIGPITLLLSDSLFVPLFLNMAILVSYIQISFNVVNESEIFKTEADME